MKLHLLCFLLICSFSNLFSQNKFRISGEVGTNMFLSSRVAPSVGLTGEVDFIL